MSNFILGSASPRRQELLTLVGIEFITVSPNVDETPIKSESPKAMVARLAHLKAKEILRQTGARRLPFTILSADTTVVSPSGKIFGKPKNLAEAKRMLLALQGKKHQVYTGYAILFLGANHLQKKVIRVVKTDVWIKKMNRAAIESYLEKGESLDKAGAYAAQGYGMALVEKLSGSYSNVVGLPLSQVMDDLKRIWGRS